MSASDQPLPNGQPHQVQLHAAYEGTIADGFGHELQLGGVDRLYLMVTAVFDRLTDADGAVPKTAD